MNSIEKKQSSGHSGFRTFFLLWNGIMPMSTPRMTSCYSFESHPGSFYRPPNPNSLKHIIRTSWCIPTRLRQNGTDDPLINPNQENDRKTYNLLQVFQHDTKVVYSTQFC